MHAEKTEVTRMKLTELIKLSTSGYSVADIRELSEMSKENPEIMQLADGKHTLAEVKEIIALASDDEPVKEKAADAAESEQTAQQEDPKQKEVEELKAKLAEAQQANTRKEIRQSQSIDPEVILADIFESVS